MALIDKDRYVNNINFWDGLIPTKVYFGRDSRKHLKSLCTGKRILIISTKNGRLRFESDMFLEIKYLCKYLIWVDNVKSNPTLKDITVQSKLIRNKFDYIIAFGGGSVIDSAKALSVLLKAKSNYTIGDLAMNSEIINEIEPIPLIAIPTTSGTGSEVTPFATIWDSINKKKYSLLSDKLYPHVTFIDSELTLNLNEEITISTGLDAINQAFESIWNRNANHSTIRLATESLKLGIVALPKLIDLIRHNEDSNYHRSMMSESSLLSGMAISKTRTALCHSISYPITAYFNVPHGLACAFTMASVLRLNIEAKDERFNQLALDLGCQNTKSLINIVDQLVLYCNVQDRIKSIVQKKEKLINIVDQMYTANRADNVLFNVNKSIILNILHESWDSVC
jgi:phosphonate metabolism-associated iron-containing alcohol dehydrogenase